MKFSLFSVGKTKQNFVSDGVDFYLKRIKKYTSFDYNEIPLPGAGFKGSRDEITAKECKLLSQSLKGNEFVILLDEKGHEFSSEKFAGYIQHLMNTQPAKIAFVIGGAYGFSEEFRKTASTSISLSCMTFPHQLIRVIFLEQFYRAMTILKNEPYHHP